MKKFISDKKRIMAFRFILLFGFLFITNLNLLYATSNKKLGKLTPERTCFDVKKYDIYVKIQPESKTITGYVDISFLMLSESKCLQLDFANHMLIERVEYDTIELEIKRKADIFFVKFEDKLIEDSNYSIRIHFQGKPQEAKLPPWEGGFVWNSDLESNDWIGLACESLGSSAWFPCKDHWSDEAESLDVHLEVPFGLIGVSNGKLIDNYSKDSGYQVFHWQVMNPINNYNISINVGKYAVINDTFNGINTVPLKYYVLNYNQEIAEQHFQQVKVMLEAFEHYFGPYPFPEDSYKLVETPYWGMEHQSCIAYGNNYRNNIYGFDFIIIHESGHEWFANSITASDAADMWIHESFTTYSEALFVEYTIGYSRSVEYLLDQRKKIVSKKPMLGKRGIFYHNKTDSDIYYKGTWVLHTMRNVLNNDSLWFELLKGLNTNFYHKIIRTEDIIDYFNVNTNYNWYSYFNQYLKSTEIPLIEVKSTDLGNGIIEYTMKLSEINSNFELPIHLKYGDEYLDIILSKQSEKVQVPASFNLFSYINSHYLVNLKY
ncbi:MAG: M1 family metallopeptidase [Bacteroidia bacterium]